VKCSLIGEGEHDLFVHPVPYLKEWDTCAPEVLLTEAGRPVTDCLGEPFRCNKRITTQPHGNLATRPGVHEGVLETMLAEYLSSGTVPAA
jgi:3'-phosphoadenosine 5'-phosphosulfate (PAPS) 3'-phosphatase